MPSSKHITIILINFDVHDLITFGSEPPSVEDVNVWRYTIYKYDYDGSTLYSNIWQHCRI